MAAPESTAAGQSLEVEESTSVSWKIWATLCLLSLGAIIAWASRTNIAEALAYKPFVDFFNLSDIDKGLINSAFFWSYAALQIPTGWLVDRYGVKIPYAISFFIWCIASAATGVARTASQLTSIRVVTGAGEAIVTPASFTWMRKHFTEKNSGLAVGIYMLGTKFGPAIGSLLAAWLITRYDWRLMFILIGLVGLLWLIPWVVLVEKDKPVAGQGRKANKPGVAKIPFRNIMASPVVWGTIVINFCYNYFVFYCISWMPDYLVKQRHLSITKMGLFQFFSFTGIALVALIAGWLADLMVKRGWDPVAVRKGFVIAGFAIACTELLGVRTSSLHVALFWAIVSLSAIGLATANHLALCRLTLIPAGAVGLVTGVQNVSTSLAGAAAPAISGWLKQTTGGYTAPMQAIFFFLVLGALTCLVMLRREWAPKAAAVAATG